MSSPPSVEQRLAVSRALCVQALQQPAWLLLLQRVCAKPAHAHSEQHKPASNTAPPPPPVTGV